MKSARIILVFALAFSPLMAHATDLSAKKKSNENSQQSANQIDWTGFYVGGNLNSNTLTNNQTYDLFFYDTPEWIVGPTPPIPSKSERSKYSTGLHIGYDKQIGASVIGLQATFDPGSLRVADKLAAPYGYAVNTSGDPYINPYIVCDEVIGCRDDVKTSVSSLRTVTARLGYLFQPQLLFYLKGGMAWAKFEYEHNNAPDYFGSAKETRMGWDIGGGIEYSVAKNWSAFFEYNRFEFENKKIILNYIGAPPYPWTNENSIDMLKFGFNYHL